jgi:anaerobic magnesium-protoporphyrin IX monomethyl ester cyclase
MSKIRVALVKPPERTSLDFGCFSLAVLAAYQKDIALVKIFDSTSQPIDEAATAVNAWAPNIIGVTTMAIDSVGPTVALIKRIREIGYTGLVVAGGHGATMLPSELLENGADAVVYGEGESTFREVITSGVSEEVRGLFLLQEGKLTKTPPRPPLDMDQLPPPARHLMNPPQGDLVMLETSRGCPHHCAFCETTKFHGNQWRGRSPQNVARDVHDLVSAGAKIITISDDNFLANPERAKQISEELSNKKLPLFFIFSARSDDLLRDPEVIPALARSHFLRVNVGVETVAPELSAIIRKTITLDEHRRAFQAMREAGIYSVASFIVGLPGETEQMRSGYLQASVELADSAVFLPFQPLPGIDLGDGSCQPEPWCIELAEALTKQFQIHPSVIKKLLKAAREPTVRGMLARTSLQNRLKSRALDKESSSWLQEELQKISS